jgi:hypothetical protein
VKQHHERAVSVTVAPDASGEAYAASSYDYFLHRLPPFGVCRPDPRGEGLSDILRSMKPLALLERAVGWIRNHPEDLLGAAIDAAALKLTIPLDALRFLAAQAKGKNAPEDLDIVAVPPGLRVGATLNAMRTKLRVSGTLLIDEMSLSQDELRFTVRLRHVSLAVIGTSESPVATLINSGALDLSRPGKLISNLPKRPAFVVEADGDRVVIDLMRDPKLARRLGKAAALLTPLLTVRSVESKGDALLLQLACLPNGLLGAIGSIRDDAR